MKTIIIDWDTQDVYVDDFSRFKNDLVEQEAVLDFDRWLANNYDAGEIFQFSEKDKEEVREEYFSYVDVEATAFVNCGDYTVITINANEEIEVK